MPFLARHYRDIPHPYSVADLSIEFMQAYFPEPFLLKKSSLIARYDGEIKAALVTVPSDRKKQTAYVALTLVDPTYRARGLGSLLRAIALERLQSEGFTQVGTLIDDSHEAV